MGFCIAKVRIGTHLIYFCRFFHFIHKKVYYIHTTYFLRCPNNKNTNNIHYVYENVCIKSIFFLIYSAFHCLFYKTIFWRLKKFKFDVSAAMYIVFHMMPSLYIFAFRQSRFIVIGESRLTKKLQQQLLIRIVQMFRCYCFRCCGKKCSVFKNH